MFPPIRNNKIVLACFGRRHQESKGAGHTLNIRLQYTRRRINFYLYLYDTFHAFWVSTCDGGGGGAVVSAASTTHTTKEHSISHQIFARFLIFTHTQLWKNI